MKCTRVRINGVNAIVCASRYVAACCKCRTAPAPLQCDWKLPNGRTCDKYICDSCTTSPAPGKDLCPEHAAAWAADPRNPKASGATNG